MDSATAALLGATVGVLGTLTAPMVTGYQAKRAKAQDLMREAYARGFACLAKIPRSSSTPDDLMKLRDKMLDALAHIEIVGTKKTSDLYSEVVDSFTAWKIDGSPNAAFETSAKEFQESARRDTAVADASGLSTPAIVLRLVAPIVVLSLYWWLRTPFLFQSTDRAFAGWETSLALVLTIVGGCCAVDATVRLFTRMRTAQQPRPR